MKTKSFKEILKETIQRNCTDDYDGMFLFFESSVIEAHNEYASQFQQDRTFWGRLESFVSNVQVNDPMSEEEKEYILNVAKQFNPKQS